MTTTTAPSEQAAASSRRRKSSRIKLSRELLVRLESALQRSTRQQVNGVTKQAAATKAAQTLANSRPINQAPDALIEQVDEQQAHEQVDARQDETRFVFLARANLIEDATVHCCNDSPDEGSIQQERERQRNKGHRRQQQQRAATQVSNKHNDDDDGRVKTHDEHNQRDWPPQISRITSSSLRALNRQVAWTSERQQEECTEKGGRAFYCYANNLNAAPDGFISSRRRETKNDNNKFAHSSETTAASLRLVRQVASCEWSGRNSTKSIDKSHFYRRQATSALDEHHEHEHRGQKQQPKQQLVARHLNEQQHSSNKLHCFCTNEASLQLASDERFVAAQSESGRQRPHHRQPLVQLHTQLDGFTCASPRQQEEEEQEEEQEQDNLIKNRRLNRRMQIDSKHKYAPTDHFYDPTTKPSPSSLSNLFLIYNCEQTRMVKQPLVLLKQEHHSPTVIKQLKQQQQQQHQECTRQQQVAPTTSDKRDDDAPLAVKRRRNFCRHHHLLWALSAYMLALILSSCSLVSNKTGGLFMQSSAMLVPAPALVTQSDELSRAVLATMSTQSTLSSVVDQNNNNNNNSTEARAELLQYNNNDELVTSERPQTQTQTNTNTSATQTEFENYLYRANDFARIFAMVAIMIGDICGNSLVILSVVRHSKLRITTNWFVVSLACADILVAVFAMTFNASVQITGKWIFPRWMCDFWNSCDVLASTASILHLCCISIDRYYAIMRPLDYPMKITTRRVCYALAVVWVSSALLSYIPIFTGIYTTAEHIQWQQDNPDQCEFVVNRVYAIVSSSISFWIPCCIMVFTYYRIYEEATRQEKFIYKAQSMMPQVVSSSSNHHHHHHEHSSEQRAKQRRSKSMAITSSGGGGGGARGGNEARIKQFAAKQQLANDLNKQLDIATTNLTTTTTTTNAPQTIATTDLSSVAAPGELQPLTGSAIDLNNNSNKSQATKVAATTASSAKEDDDRDSNSGQSTPTKRSISKMKREHKAAKTLGIIMGVFILCWLPFFSWYTPQHICGHACDGIIPKSAVTLLFWIGYFNSTLNPIIYAYFNHEFRDAFKKTLQWIFCCCRDLKCLRVNRPNDNQHYNCTYRSTQEIGLVTSS